ncbi:glycoprotein integral membrane protein 1 [Ascaphus truei]|uniref:glycoprotein integral membrane protein 1 n=1 Tax=Ascaphus truei TaxID=8439 RepID=UPI003F5ABB65
MDVWWAPCWDCQHVWLAAWQGCTGLLVAIVHLSAGYEKMVECMLSPGPSWTLVPGLALLLLTIITCGQSKEETHIQEVMCQIAEDLREKLCLIWLKCYSILIDFMEVAVVGVIGAAMILEILRILYPSHNHKEILNLSDIKDSSMLVP